MGYNQGVEAKQTMKRAAIGLLMLCSAAALAQAPFTIVRPQDGARVREVVQIRFPVRSVPQGGFIGVSINGKFVEAVAPAALDSDRERGHYIYRWDTKRLNVPDGEHTIELTLYSNPEGGAGARVLGRSSVRLQVENTIKVPAEGVFLRYQWTPGKMYRYDVRAVVKEVNEVQYSGLTPEETMLVDISFKGDLNVMDFRNNLGLISWTPVPPVIEIQGGQPNVINSDRMAPVYQEIETTGRVRYQVSRLADSQQADVYYFWTADLPSLPPRRYKPGDRWNATIARYNPLRSGDVNEVGELIPVAARLERFEWERGYKCAKIVYEFTGNLPGEIELGGVQLEKPKSVVRRTVYFAYDIGQVIRMTTAIQLEGTVRQDQFGGGIGGSGGFGGPPGFGRGSGGPGFPEDEGGMRGGRGSRGPAAAGGLGTGVGAGVGGPPRGGGFGGGAQTGARNVINRFVFEVDMTLHRIF
ncbi:MAG: hypothetical protein KatS3mg017_0354 [Fimbriimonadales bacterium]|nr:MAG: hypothetical protein KatS3mg017_0354 [Fimbriimonadales bacterium]